MSYEVLELAGVECLARFKAWDWAEDVGQRVSIDLVFALENGEVIEERCLLPTGLPELERRAEPPSAYKQKALEVIHQWIAEGKFSGSTFSKYGRNGLSEDGKTIRYYSENRGGGYAILPNFSKVKVVPVSSIDLVVGALRSSTFCELLEGDAPEWLAPNKRERYALIRQQWKEANRSDFQERSKKFAETWVNEISSWKPASWEVRLTDITPEKWNEIREAIQAACLEFLLKDELPVVLEEPGKPLKDIFRDCGVEVQQLPPYAVSFSSETDPLTPEAIAALERRIIGQVAPQEI